MKRYTLVLCAMAVLVSIGASAIGAGRPTRAKQRRQSNVAMPGMVMEKTPLPSVPPRIADPVVPPYPPFQVDVDPQLGQTLQARQRIENLMAEHIKAKSLQQLLKGHHAAPATSPSVAYLEAARAAALDPRTPGLHKQAATLLTQANLPPPTHRAGRFSWLANPRYRLMGWGGFIESVIPAPGGYKVTVRVSPQFTANNQSATCTDYTLETYLIANDKIRLIGVEDSLEALAGNLVLTD
jgi:hypothetical protein